MSSKNTRLLLILENYSVFAWKYILFFTTNQKSTIFPQSLQNDSPNKSQVGLRLNDHYRRIWNDKSCAAICGANPINIMNLSTVQNVLV